MKRLSLALAVIVATVCGAALVAQRAQDRSPRRESEPEIKINPEDVLKADHKKALEDAGELLKLAEEIKADLEKNDLHILSMKTVKKTEEIEKVARRLRGRLQKF
jgi:hypothetical protein